MQADRRYDNIVSNLLGRIIVVDDINEASRVARDNGFRSKVVTMDGQVINAGGSFTGGSVSAAQACSLASRNGRAAGESGQVTDCLAAGKDRPLQRAGGCPSGRADRRAGEQITAANDKVRAEAERSGWKLLPPS
ncbi:MAG: hypothetical protein ACLTNY_00150 [Blautia massiliensis (ex Durand et al. 2017)]